MLGMHGRRANVEFMKKLTAIADDKANCFALFHGDLRGLVEIVADGDLDRAIGLGGDAGGTYRGAFAMHGIGESRRRSRSCEGPPSGKASLGRIGQGEHVCTCCQKSGQEEGRGRLSLW